MPEHEPKGLKRHPKIKIKKQPEGIGIAIQNPGGATTRKASELTAPRERIFFLSPLYNLQQKSTKKILNHMKFILIPPR